ncbi:DUF6080 domain-containing protein [Paenibacillus durus]|uniref:Glycosyltransferase RgtA/B/C/D-like domain-containing protein n=1 Tax=Paenibacillus durus ATCC 35681 TaxID=1333534 RepID=A0A0F7FC10_PAEDU|nr:DUF6080 domain-containing protein [Paenibacillus durus]AKG36295.1 hypothetical protein VK70_18450 [Paenibacillus durus ATCC 35681]
MSFYSYYFRNKKDNRIAAALWLVFFVGYILVNMPYVQYIKENADMLGAVSPFYSAPFTLNLFNFDPSMEYGSSAASVIHPLYNFLTAPFTDLSAHWLGNSLFLLLQSAINAFTAVLIFFILRKSGANLWISILFSVFFGVSSYSLFSAFIPDSYPYAQLVIVLSAAYLQKGRDLASFPVLTGAFLTLINFGITATNLITFTGALFISMFNPGHMKKTLTRFALIMAGSLLLLIAFTGLQYVVFSGKTWISDLAGGMSNGALRYVAPFSFAQNSGVFHMLAVNPVLTPNITLIDPGIVAFGTDVNKPYPLYVHAAGLGLIALAVLGWIRGIRTREAWSLAVYILFAFWLHIIRGFGLATYKYDLYLYAGHFLFAFFLLAAGFVRDAVNRTLQTILIVLVSLLVLTTLVNNIVKHLSALDYIQSAYTEVITTSGK